MSITFYDKQEAEEYRKSLADDGLASSIKKILQQNKKVWIVKILNKSEQSQRKQLTKRGIRPEHIIEYEWYHDTENPYQLAIKYDIPNGIDYVTLSHEFAHQKLKHQDLDIKNMTKAQRFELEKEAWKLTVKQLKSAGEWTRETKKEAILSLSSYDENAEWIEEISDSVSEEAKNFINNL